MNKPSALINLVIIAIAQGYSREEGMKIAKSIMEKCKKNGVVLSWEGSKKVADAVCDRERSREIAEIERRRAMFRAV